MGVGFGGINDDGDCSTDESGGGAATIGVTGSPAGGAGTTGVTGNPAGGAGTMGATGNPAGGTETMGGTGNPAGGDDGGTGSAPGKVMGGSVVGASRAGIAIGCEVAGEFDSGAEGIGRTGGMGNSGE